MHRKGKEIAISQKLNRRGILLEVESLFSFLFLELIKYRNRYLSSYIFILLHWYIFAKGGNVMPTLKREQLYKESIPKYSSLEEMINYTLHFIGILFGIFVLFYVVKMGLKSNLNSLKFISLIVYSVSTIALYSVSFSYHLCRPNSPYKKVLRVVDHNTIYLLIAGTYFPVVALSLSLTSIIIIMSIEVLSIFIGVLLNVLSFHNSVTKIITTVIYVVMGWVLICFKETYTLMPLNSFIYILVGGIIYSIGVIIYVLGKKKKYFHSLFHLLVLFGTVIQFIGIAFMI